MTNYGAVFTGNNSTTVIQKIWKEIKENGKFYQGQRGKVKTLRGITVIIDNPLESENNYPYWAKKEDDWYQNNFVRKETNLPPEKPATDDIYCYKYVWRSRYYDSGFGYVLATINTLKKAKIDLNQINSIENLKAMIRKTYKYTHPEIILAVLGWQGKNVIQNYIKNEASKKFLEKTLKRSRNDTLENAINEIKINPSSRRAVTASFTYENIDHSGIAGAVPVYQNYQLLTEFDQKGKPIGLASFHFHRALDAYGGIQLDINHDRDWGLLASKVTGLPLKKLVIYCSDIYSDESVLQHKSVNKTSKSIKDWLRFVVDSYSPSEEDIEKRINSDRFNQKFKFTLSKLN